MIEIQKDRLKELYKHMIDDAILTQDMSVVYMVFVAHISADNNITEEEIKGNCEALVVLSEVLAAYSDNAELQKMRSQCIEYNSKYMPKEGSEHEGDI